MTSASDRLGHLEQAIYSKVLEVIRLLRESNQRIVLAESCTGGLVSAAFTSVPGVSDVFCGSMVVYRNDTKSKWLGLDEHMLAEPKIGPVSPQASEELARKVLLLTPEANLALSITGHLGPNAPAALNRKVFFAGVHREPKSEPQSPNNQGLGLLGREPGKQPLIHSQECNLERSRFFNANLSDNRRFLQSLALWETLCFGEATLNFLKNVEFAPNSNFLKKNDDI
jgi:PncC family amidohydrolase